VFEIPAENVHNPRVVGVWDAGLLESSPLLLTPTEVRHPLSDRDVLRTEDPGAKNTDLHVVDGRENASAGGAPYWSGWYVHRSCHPANVAL
jgi:hypothetical protein